MDTPKQSGFRLSGGTMLSYSVAGDRRQPALLLLHGFPNAARMFRHLIPDLKRSAFIIAPDLPAFGASDVLPEMTFARMGAAVSELLDHLSVGKFFIYLHDFGTAVGLELALQAPDKVLGLVVQNANAHRSGFGPAWADTQAFWREPTFEREAKATAHLTLEGMRDQYVSGVPAEIAARIPPEVWQEDWRVMNLPGRLEAQRSLVRDYGRYAGQFDRIAAYLQRWQPPALMLWGRHDVFFDLAEIVSWMKDLPRMEAHVFDAGHALLETHSPPAAALIRDFLSQHHPHA